MTQVQTNKESMEFLRERFTPSLEECLGPFFNYYVFYDGRFVKGIEAAIPVWDHALLYGDGVFEGIRINDGKIFKLEEHMTRLFDSAKALRMSRIPLSKSELTEAVIRTVKINNFRDAHIRPIITRGSGKPGTDPNRAVRSSILVLANPFPPLLGDNPARLFTSSVRRKSPHSVDPRIKSLNYLDNVLAKIQANAAGADDAILLDINSFVAEATGENIFFVRGHRVYTPTTTAALTGITRETVIELSEKLGYPVEQKNVTLGELYTADEVFVSGTGAGIHPVSEIDGRKIGESAPGEFTSRLKKVYEDYIRKEHVTVVFG